MTTLPLLPAEAELLLRCAGGSEQDGAIHALIQRDLHWRRLCRIALDAQAVPVLWRRIMALGHVPSPASAQLQQLAMVAEFRLLRLRQRLYQSLDVLDAANVPTILLKGAGVAHSAYPEFALRPMRDIDLLVDPTHAARAAAALRDVGWNPKGGSMQAPIYAGLQHLPPFDDAAGTDIGLDLHTQLLVEGAPFRLPPSTVWARARTVSRPGGQALVPDPGHQLLHACIHFAWQHMMGGTGWRTFRDVAAIAATGEVDWDRFVPLAQETGGAACCYWTFALGRAAAGVQVPETVTRALRPRKPAAVLRRMERHFVLGLLPTPFGCPSLRLGRMVWQFAIRPEHGGTAQPWDRNHFFAAAPEAGPAPTLRQKVARHARRAPDWARYIGSVLGGRAPNSAPVQQQDSTALRPSAAQ